jgi:3-deoxy-7-phosphoheptulonate synthase
MIDASHGNSGKDPSRQQGVAAAIASQLADGNRAIVAVMLESNLEAGRQEPGAPATLTYGQSVTDACIGIEETGTILRNLAAAARARRSAGEVVP